MTSRSTIWLTCVGTFAFGVASPASAPRAENAIGCPESGMPIETLGSEKSQRLAIYEQAKACVNGGKPLAYCYFNRGSLYLTLGEHQKAINDLTEALKGRQGDSVALTRRAQAYQALGRKSEALDDFRAALDANPKLETAQEGFERIVTEQQRSERHK